MPFRMILSALLLFIALATNSYAHFGILIPSRSMVMSQKDAAIHLDIAFSHPFSGIGMAMDPPAEAFASCNGKKVKLELAPQTYMGQSAFQAQYLITRPGVYQFAVSPQPYYEEAEDSFIIHYPKTIIGAFGYDEDWDRPLGMPVEIVPLSRPFGNYAGNTFSGLALKDGKPLANADVEVEFLNSAGRYIAPNSYFVTQSLKTDDNGQFTFGIPWPGWWGFAVLTESENRIEHNGSLKNVELGGIIWLEFYAPALTGK